MTRTKRPISVAFTRIAEVGLAMGLGGGKLQQIHLGTWRYKLRTDERWEFEINAHKEACVSQMLPNTNVAPFNAHVQYNGWPFGILNPFGGVTGSGECANEDAFIEALEKEIRSYGAEPEPQI